MLGKITVTIQERDRLAAIFNLSVAVKECAIALSAVPKVEISNNVFKDCDPGVKIDTKKDVEETIIMESGAQEIADD